MAFQKLNFFNLFKTVIHLTETGAIDLSDVCKTEAWFIRKVMEMKQKSDFRGRDYT